MNAHNLVYNNDYIDIAFEETPQLLDYVLSIAKKKHRNKLLKKHIKDYMIPYGAYKYEHISNVNMEVLKMMLEVRAFKDSYPLVYYSVKHFVYHKKF